MDFEDLIPKKDSGEDLQPPVAAASVNFEDLVPGELEETSVLSIGNPYREQRGAFYPGSTDIYGNLMFDSNVGLLGGIKKGASTIGEMLTGQLDPRSLEGQRRLTETAFMFSPMSTASRAASKAYRTMVPNAPSREALEEAADAGYKAVRKSGAEYSVPAIKEFAKTLKGRLDSEGFIEPITGGVHALISRLIKDPEGSVGVNINALDAFRKTMSKLAGNPDATTASAASIAIKAVDEFVETAGKTPSMASPLSPSGATAIAAKEIVPARANRAAAFRAETIEELRRVMNLKADATHSGGNLDNTIRQKLVPIVTQAKKSRGFSPQELEAMEQIIQGTPTRNALRRFSKLLGGGGGMQQFFTGVLPASTAAIMNPSVQGLQEGAMYGLGAVLAGNTARQASEALANRQLDRLSNLVRSRSPAGGGGPVSQYAPREYLRVPGRAGGRATLMELGRALQQPKSLSENRPKSQLERQREEAYKRFFYGRGGGV